MKTPPLLLIARREFFTYVATLSFWAALVAPLVLVGVLLAVQQTPEPQHATLVVDCTEPALAASARDAFAEAAGLEGWTITDRAPQGARLTCAQTADGATQWEVTGDVLLSDSGLALLERTLQRDMAVGEGAATAASATRLSVQAREAGTEPGPDLGRFGLLMMLWLVLTGSLGMLLQAVVRERSTRSLEMLLAAARPKDIVVGKLVGVGAVSTLVLATWLVGAGLLTFVLPERAAHLGLIGMELGEPFMLLRAGAIYVLAFAFYGFLILALGAAAQDSASAQNLSRPLFIVLVAVLFTCLSEVLNGGGVPIWQLYLPPLTPFVLLLGDAASQSWLEQLLAMVLLAVCTVFAGRWAIRCLTLVPGNPLNALRRKRRAR